MHFLETCGILEVLKQSSDEEVCNYDNGSDIDIFESKESIATVINSENDEIEEVVGAATVKKPKLEDQDNW
jgi:hypothetical protein